MANFLSLSPETQALSDALRAVSLGATITYAALSESIGRDVTGPARATLVSARRIVLRDFGAVFEVKRAHGLRRLKPDEAPDIGSAARRKIRRTSSRAMKSMHSVVNASNGLSPEAGRKLSAEMSTHGLMVALAADKVAHTMQSETRMPPAIAATAFLKHIGALEPNEGTKK